MPLSTGASPVNLALGIGLVGFVGAAPVFISSLLPLFFLGVSGIVLAIWFFALSTLPFVARKQRASDVVLEASGVSIVGGPYDGQHVKWSELSAAPAKLTWGGKGQDCCLALPGGRQIVTSEPDERASLGNLARTLNAFAKGHQAAQAEAKTYGQQARVPTCPQCGAPLTPSTEPTVQCVHCRAQCALPERVRNEVVALQKLVDARTHTQSALGILSRWPASRTLNLVLASASIPLVLGWPVSGALASEYFQYHDVFRWRDVGVLFVSTAALSLGLCFWLSAQVVHRQAFGLVVASFHAVRLSDDGLGCHACGAPLPVAPDAPLVACVFCRADNVVLGLDLAPRVEAESSQARSLDDLLRQRLGSLKFWRRLSFVAALLIVSGGAFLFEPLQRAFNDPGPRHAPVDRAWSYPGPSR
jgi:hypothetical protein